MPVGEILATMMREPLGMIITGFFVSLLGLLITRGMAAGIRFFKGRKKREKRAREEAKRRKVLERIRKRQMEIERKQREAELRAQGIKPPKKKKRRRRIRIGGVFKKIGGLFGKVIKSVFKFFWRLFLRIVGFLTVPVMWVFLWLGRFVMLVGIGIVILGVRNFVVERVRGAPPPEIRLPSMGQIKDTAEQAKQSVVSGIKGKAK